MTQIIINIIPDGGHKSGGHCECDDVKVCCGGDCGDECGKDGCDCCEDKCDCGDCKDCGKEGDCKCDCDCDCETDEKPEAKMDAKPESKV